MKKHTKIIPAILALILLSTLTQQAFAVDTASETVTIKITEFAGSGETGYNDGDKLTAKFAQPYGLALDKDGSILVTDSLNHRIRRIKDDKVTTVAGLADKEDTFGLPKGGLADGDAAKARFNQPRGIVVDSQGNIFIADYGNNAIRKINTKGKVYTFAGNGKPGMKDGKGTEAQLNGPSGLAIDQYDNVFVADTGNHVIRKINYQGEVSTFAGTGTEGYLDGEAAKAQFNEPSDVKLDSKGRLYVLDCGNQLLRRITKGVVATISGTKGAMIEGTAYAQGGFQDGMNPHFNFPKGMSIMPDGTVFIADTWNHRIRAIKPDGEVVTIAGNGIPGRKSGSLTDTMLNGPVSVLYSSGRIYIADLWNNSIRTMPVDTTKLVKITSKEELLQGIAFEPVSDRIQVYVDKKKLVFPDIQPQILHNRTMVPLRMICETWGAAVNWKSETNQMEITKNSFHKLYTINKEPISTIENNSMIQLRDLAESMGFSVLWVQEYRAVVISTQ